MVGSQSEQGLTGNRPSLDALAAKLLEAETLRRDEVQVLLAGVQRDGATVPVAPLPGTDGATAPPVDAPTARQPGTFLGR